MNNYKVEYILDSKIDNTLNLKLIESLSICFPEQQVFKTQRYYHELPKHRWFMEVMEKVIAHVAVHEKVVNTDFGELKIAGIAEVYVLPDFRGKGLVKLLLESAHSWAHANNFDFAMLYGDKNVYSSSGYKVIDNPIKYFESSKKKWIIESSPDAMIKKIKEEKWPNGIIDINGPTF